MTVLDEIVEYKKELLKSGYYEEKINTLKTVDISHKNTFECIVRSDDVVHIIAELKAKSPTVKDIPALDMEVQLEKYDRGGASAISILTDEYYFGGSYERLNQLTTKTDLPVLCKDFIIDEIQIDTAQKAGASIILLIVSILTEERLNQLMNYAISKGLEVLVEVHDAEELVIAERSQAKIIGVNNRNLKTFKTDIKQTMDILTRPHPDKIYISESGIKSIDDIQKVKHIVNGALIGEALMKHHNTEQLIREMKVRRAEHHVH